MGQTPPETGCWPWTGRVNEGGYGVIETTADTGRVRVRAHRVSYELFVGEIPDGLILRHTCDNPPCCRPDHLLIGTRTENSADKVARGRQSKGPSHAIKTRGERHYNARLTVGQVSEIRKLYAGGTSQRKLAVLFGVGQSQIQRIVNRESWATLIPPWES